MPHLVAAPDKYRGTATAAAVAAAAAGAARALGWTADEVPLADGGEGTLEALGGEPRHTVVTGPLGRPVRAEWRLVDGTLEGSRRRHGTSLGQPTAVIEAARAAGRALLPAPRDDDALKATTTGVGELVLAAVDAGAAHVVVGAGGTATTDGGWGAITVIGSPERLRGAKLTVACDVDLPFSAAAPVFGPQKGAGPAQVGVLAARLAGLAGRYRETWGIDVERLPGSGAAGGLAGGLAALGADLVAGFPLVAAAVGLERRLAAADVVVTGEGRLDATSFSGKVVGGVVRLAGRAPVLCVVGDMAAGTDPHHLAPGSAVEVVTLTHAVGRRRAWEDTAAAVAEVVADRLGALAHRPATQPPPDRPPS